ncbi:MAG: ABC transporter permease [Rhodospirillales bacterium]|nr:ABC transporter permease [Rhodospirillales bacterium]
MILASQVWTQIFWTSVIAGGLLAGVPLMFTALGEAISERAGVLNIGLEGMMLAGAYCGFLGAYYGGNQWVGYLAGIGAGILASLIMVALCVWLGLDQIVVGIAITLAGEGITSVLYQARFSAEQPRLGNLDSNPIPLLDRIPVLGKAINGQTPLFDQPLIVYLGLTFAFVLAWVFRRTNVGLNLRAAGEKPEALDAAGVSVVATRSYAVLATGSLAGLGGAYLAIAGTGGFQPFLTQGQGFMAIVIAMLARGRPIRVVVFSLMFGIALSLSTVLQLAGIELAPEVVNMLPFAAVILALILFARRAYLPPALALAYVRGAR